MSDFKLLEIERDGAIATVTFRRERKANALNSALIEEIEAAALSFRDDEDTRCVIFTGAGKHFTSGADLTETETPHPRLTVQRRRRRIGERAIQALLSMDQITIAAWNGGAMGGGACVATALDFRIGTESSFIAYPEIDIGVNLMWTSLPLICHLVGPARAKQLVIGGAWVHGKTLLDWGVMDEVVAESELLGTARKWAEFYASKPPVAAQMIKRSVNAISTALDRSIMHADFDQHLLASATEDRDEAVSAYLEKRPPTFEGR
jgi:enoyl-CoA hydratase/carnithine racemase